MSLDDDFIESLVIIPTTDILDILKEAVKPAYAIRWNLTTEIGPSDLYCYLFARFGPPNGIQNFLREDDSDNLIHWDWFLRSTNGFLTVQGMSFRTEIWITSSCEVIDSDKDNLIQQFKSSFSQYGKTMSSIRKSLEPWTEFVNPYHRIRNAIYSLMSELTLLDLDEEPSQVPNLKPGDPIDEWKAEWKKQADKYSRGIGLCFGVRSMLPVMAEAYINLLLYVLMKPQIRADERLRDSKVRQQIDIRIRSLSHDCIGFKQTIDFDHPACKKYHTLVNERNDLLHGNVVIDKLRFNEVYFSGKIPIFKQYLSRWQRAFGINRESVGLDTVHDELATVEEFIGYINQCLDDKVREDFLVLAAHNYLGIRQDTGLLGILFPEWLVDFVPILEHDEHIESES